MASHSLKKNYRSSKNLVKYINDHCPDSTSKETLVYAGDICEGEDEDIKYPTKLNDIAQAMSEKIESGSVAVLCRTNSQVRQWQLFLENIDCTKGKTRLIEDEGLKVHRLWPIWWFFHGYSHLHPVPKDQFHGWCNKLELGDCQDKNDCTCAKDFGEVVNYPNKENNSTPCVKIKQAAGGCPKKQMINGRWDDSLTLEKALNDLKEASCINEWFDDPILSAYISDYKAQWEQMLKDIEGQYPPQKEVKWSNLWVWFEEYYDEIENDLPVDKIIISTIHKAKGCEFDTVFLWNWKCKNSDASCSASELTNSECGKNLGIENEVSGVFWKSTVCAEKKIFYVGCSRPSKNLYVLTPDLMVHAGSNVIPRRLATPSEVTNVFPLKPAFDYKDSSAKDYTLVCTGDISPHFQTCWNSGLSAEQNHNQYLHPSLRSGERDNYHAVGNSFAVYFQGSGYGDIPLILPVIEPTLMIVEKESFNAGKFKYSARVNPLNNSAAAEEIRDKCGEWIDLPASFERFKINIRGLPILKALKGNKTKSPVFLYDVQDDAERKAWLIWLDNSILLRVSNDAQEFAKLRVYYPDSNGFILFENGCVCIAWPPKVTNPNCKVGTWECIKNSIQINNDQLKLKCEGFQHVSNIHWEVPASDSRVGLWIIPD